MTWGLRTYVYDAWAPWQEITDIARGLVVRSAVHGGLQTIEFDIADRWVDAYRWAYEHIGSKVYVHDNALTPPVAEGVIFEPAISQDGNRIIAYGPWLAYCFSQVYNDTATWTAGGQTGAQIQDMLTTECPGVSTNQSNIDEPGTANWPWQPSGNAYPGDLIPGLAALSDASDREWYFWLRSAALSGTTPQKPIPWFKAQSSITQVYQCWRKDAAPGGLDLQPSLRELANDVRVMYRDAAGSQTQTGSATDADSQSRYGLRERWDMDLGLASAGAAAQYRDLILARYKDPQQSANFTLNNWLYDRYGGRWPLWRAIADFPFKFTINDLIPDSSVLGHTLDNKRTFITLACEYDYDSNTLTITPDTEDNRADALLARHRTFQ
jgi:hypothetical protein